MKEAKRPARSPSALRDQRERIRALYNAFNRTLACTVCGARLLDQRVLADHLITHGPSRTESVLERLERLR